jgi:hypothetical protein
MNATELRAKAARMLKAADILEAIEGDSEVRESLREILNNGSSPVATPAPAPAAPSGHKTIKIPGLLLTLVRWLSTGPANTNALIRMSGTSRKAVSHTLWSLAQRKMATCTNGNWALTAKGREYAEWASTHGGAVIVTQPVRLAIEAKYKGTALEGRNIHVREEK